MFAEILIWLEANETVLSAVAAAVVVFSVVGAAMRGALKKTSTALVGTARSTKQVLSRGQAPEIDVSQPVPGFGGRPAIAVLPFDNMSEDADQDYFADGITEDVLTSLQSFRTFPVISRNSTFAYKGKSMDLREVAAELGAGYILEGSVRKAGDKVRITGQLIDAEGHHVWADKFDRDLSDIFAVQDEITSKIVGAIAPEIDNADTRRIQSKTTENMDAWDLVLRANALTHESSAENLKQAHELANKAIELDPQFAQAYVMLATNMISDLFRFEGKVLCDGTESCVSNLEKFAVKALSIDRSIPLAHSMLSAFHIFRQQAELGLVEAEEAVRLNPSDILIITNYANALMVNGDTDGALAQLQLGKRLSPGDPGIARLLTSEALYLYIEGRYGDAEKRCLEAITARPQNPTARYVLVGILDALGRGDEARLALEEVIRIAPQSSPNFLFQSLIRWPNDVQKYREALERAGWQG